MAYAKLGRTSAHRRALFRNIITSLFAHGRIETTEAKAREIKRIAEGLITTAKRGDLHSRRMVASYLMDDAVVKSLFDTIAPKYKERAGGYTRVIKIGPRRGDAAPMVLIELV